MNVRINLAINSLLFSAHGFASSPNFLKKIEILSLSQKSVNTCKNYDGNWTGQCTDQDGVTTTDIVRIQQKSCEDVFLEVGDEKLMLNGMLVTEKRNRESESRLDQYLAWSQDGKLVSAGTISVGLDSQKYRIIGTFRRIFNLDDAVLKAQITTDSRGLPTIGHESTFIENCTYSRQP